MDPRAVQVTLTTPPRPWRHVEVHESIGSTNARALQLAQPWTVVVADHQTQGRGRLRRDWHTPAGLALTMSAALPLPEQLGWLPLIAGLATADAVEAIAGVRAVLKWPNDLLVPTDGERKLCGILCEAQPPSSRDPGLAVVGIGLNVRQSREQLPTDAATSLALCGASVSRQSLAVAILDELTARYAALLADEAGAASVRAAYRGRCATIGSTVRIVRPGGPDVLGLAVAVDDSGQLVVDGAQGRAAWAAGDVTHVRPGSEASTSLA